jgi:hypothetical protein
MQPWPREQPQRAAPSLTQSTSHAGPHSVSTFQSCSINSFLSFGLPFLETASPLPVSEFVDRRNNLAKALVADGINAFIVEPGYTFKYVHPIAQLPSLPFHSLQILKTNQPSTPISPNQTGNPGSPKNGPS